MLDQQVPLVLRGHRAQPGLPERQAPRERQALREQWDLLVRRERREPQVRKVPVDQQDQQDQQVPQGAEAVLMAGGSFSSASILSPSLFPTG